ncbi:sulfite exporter TauE/SafE family protein [Marivibrio halodurans]|uniref:Probable membrane transporter protein n=2 Tax=Marivibrio halodurans TaxID=2039722 RepID=A0A8J7S3F7_9PROT|nr:sulfite exporter TauE/SafE family protein [Marivibrio halodurans]MBP5855969.1 sulfite exporter TauE/SafE family protein [Marivibrio halodurans]
MEGSWTELLPIAVAMLGTGLIGGIMAGLLGVGGGIVIVPVLFHILTGMGIDEDIRMHIAVGTSLATIILTSASSARSHFKRGSVDTALLKSWGVPIFIGVVIGSTISLFVEGQVLTIVFAVIALIVSANMTFRPDGWTVRDSLPTGFVRHVIGAGIGTFSTMMGIGGGTLTVPILTACNYPIRRAVGTASAIGLIIAIPGTAGFIWNGLDAANLPPFSFGFVSLIGFALIVPVSVLAAPLGARIAHAIPTGLLRKAFALFLFVTAIRMFYEVFS